MRHDAVTLRPAERADLGFACDVTRVTMQAYAMATWGRWSDNEVRSALDGHVTSGCCTIVECAGDSAGVQVVQRLPTHLQLESLFLLPAFQRCRIGTGLVERLQHESQEAGLPLRLRVLKVNPAQRLYARLGFAVVSESAERLYMEWRPR